MKKYFSAAILLLATNVFAANLPIQQNYTYTEKLTGAKHPVVIPAIDVANLDLTSLSFPSEVTRVLKADGSCEILGELKVDVIGLANKLSIKFENGEFPISSVGPLVLTLANVNGKCAIADAQLSTPEFDVQFLIKKDKFEAGLPQDGSSLKVTSCGHDGDGCEVIGSIQKD